MSNSTHFVAPVYFVGRAAETQRWLRDGIPAAPTGDAPAPVDPARHGWLEPFPARHGGDTRWLVAAVAPERVTVADADLARAAASLTDPTAAAHLWAAYAASRAPLTRYRAGAYRRPAALVNGPLSPDRLAPLPTLPPSPNPTPYQRQLRQALRALVGAPADAPLPALVAAAVARHRAAFVTQWDENRPVRLYQVDDGLWYFTVEA